MGTITSNGFSLATASGSGNFVGDTSPTFTTPTLGAATATSVAFSPTTGGIIGTTAADNAGAGKVGELLSSANATGVAMTTGVATQIQTLTLTAGDWDVWCTFYPTVGGATITTSLTVGLNPTTATLANPTTAQLASIAQTVSASSAGGPQLLGVPTSRWNVSGSTTVYLNANAAYSGGTLTGNGAIYARRRR